LNRPSDVHDPKLQSVVLDIGDLTDDEAISLLPSLDALYGDNLNYDLFPLQKARPDTNLYYVEYRWGGGGGSLCGASCNTF
jgi:hypothetical protein